MNMLKWMMLGLVAVLAGCAAQEPLWLPCR
jgi:predicted small lipoprotein YifL